MTALTTGAPPTAGASLRPLPWRRMSWVTWRHHRLAAAGIVAVLGILSIYLLLTGRAMRSGYATVKACHPAGSTGCHQVALNFLSSHVHNVLVTAGLLQAIPVLIGAFVGAPLLAREFESGTFRYAWTQGIGRTRWTIAKLATLAVIVTVATWLFGLIFSWYYHPISAAGGGDSPALSPTIFDLQGVALPAWTLAAFAISVLVGTLTRRAVAAMFAALAICAALAFVTGAFVRPNYQAPVITHNPNAPTGAFVISQHLLRAGEPVTLSMVNQTLAAVDVRALSLQVFEPGPRTPPNFEDPVQYLISHGYTQVTRYQPASRYWTFQLIEAGWLLLLSVLLLGTTVQLVRRHAA